jgi:hypothetical protein
MEQSKEITPTVFFFTHFLDFLLDRTRFLNFCKDR